MLRAPNDVRWLRRPSLSIGIPSARSSKSAVSKALRAFGPARLRQLGVRRPYTVIDTFEGFVPNQFAEDERIGTPKMLRDGFADNSKRFVERTMRHYGLDEVRVIQGDICEMDPDVLPAQISPFV